MKREFHFAVLSPPALADPSIPVAAARAGGLGILDLEYTDDYEVAENAIARLVRHAGRPCGVRLDAESTTFVDQVLAGLPREVETVILTAAPRDLLAKPTRFLASHGVRVLLQITSVDQATLGRELGVDGLVAKGHESAGRVGGETTLVLLQRVVSEFSLPVWAEGGIGLHTAAACRAAGAAGVILGSQLLLTRESPLPETTKAVIARLDGSETALLGEELGDPHRVYARPRLRAVEQLREAARSLVDHPQRAEGPSPWREKVRASAGWGDPETSVWILGQDAAFAGRLAAQFRTVGGVIGAMRRAVSEHVRLARALKPLNENSPLARSHQTRYPIAQGPMTRFSDRAAFAARVAEHGALPFLAFALLRAAELKDLLEETRALLGARPWGVGILGFVPQEFREEQLEVIRAYRPSYALIAGGRPDQAQVLEKEGIATYLHVPSPGLLKLFLEAGSRRFVFEGRECGGHVGPRTSFVLWDLLTDVLLESLRGDEAADCHVLFAGGIHDALSASMVASLAAPLADRGVKIGVLMGTAYAFTEEAVASGAIVPGFQQEVIRCTETALLETGPGHAARCAATPFAERFAEEKRGLLRQELPAEEIRKMLEELNLGRLRVAAKGVTRNPRYGKGADVPKLVSVDEAGQHSQGMYMIGQAAALRNETCTIAALHHDVSVGGSRRLDAIGETPPRYVGAGPKPLEIAVIGMSCVLPKAADLETYWDNILEGLYAITEVPKTRWDCELYFDSDRGAKDKIYSKWGGFIDPVPFDPVEFGMPPNALRSVDPMQVLALKAARDALRDAGYAERPFDRAGTSVILGASGGLGDLGASYVLRTSLPMILGERAKDVVAEAGEVLPEWTEDSFAGLLPNVAAGRIANRLDLGGLNYVVDAACASSLAALYSAVNELDKANANLVVVGGVDTNQSPFGYMCFSKTQALSPSGRPRTFDAEADGIAIGEGVVMVVLKRLADAERDGDRIYAVIRGMAGSSDGKAKGLTAPRIEGQLRALQRAYAQAGFSPATVGLFEAHGTGTVVGDRTEALALNQLLEEAKAQPQTAALGSVKSMIGHTKAAAGVAGLAKVALALYHKVLPPTLGVSEPNPKARLQQGPLYVNSETRPWIHGTASHPRRGAVSAFGFGGANCHAVLEEYTGEYLASDSAAAQRWPSELLRWSGATRDELDKDLEQLQQALAQGASPRLCDLALMLERRAQAQDAARLAIVASSLDDLQGKLATAREQLARPAADQFRDPRGIYFSATRPDPDAKVAFLFPGQGSQYPDMLRDLAVHFPEVREAFERADRHLVDRFPDGLSTKIFPPPRFRETDEKLAREALSQTNVAQPALGAACLAMMALLENLGLEPGMAAGHSYGEYVALFSGGAFDEETLYRISEARGRFVMEASEDDLGTMAAAGAGSQEVAEAIEGLADVWIANRNAPNQTVISGTESGIAEAGRRLAAREIRVTRFPVSCAFHSPLVAPAKERLADFLASCPIRTTRIDVFSNTSASPYPRDPAAMVRQLSEHLVHPVEFSSELEAMYRAGARVFVEVGPRSVLTNLTRRILGDRPHTAVAADTSKRHGLVQLQHCLAQLITAGVPVRCERLYRGRARQELNLESLLEATRPSAPSPTTWLVDGGRARPLHSGQPPGAAEERTPRPAPIPEPQEEPPEPDALPRQPVLDVLEVHQEDPPTTADRAMATDPELLPRVAIPPASSDDAASVMLRHQELMARFLETQQQVMLAYLNGSSDVIPLSSPARAPAVTDAVPKAAGPAPQQPHGPVEEQPSPVSETSQESAPQDAKEAIADPAEQEAGVAVDAAHLTSRLLELVSERTGYPTEMLDLDLDIEAELGVDSIKRVEVLALFQNNCLPEGWEIGESAMEELLKAKTMRGIVDRLVDAYDHRTDGAATSPSPDVKATTSAAPKPEPEQAAAPPVERDELSDVPRFLFSMVDAPLEPQHLPAPHNGVLLVTDDEQGTAEELVRRLRERGVSAVRVRVGSAFAAEDQHTYAADLTDPAAIEELLQHVTDNHGPPAGIVHLVPLRDSTRWEAMDLARWQARMREELKSLFYLAQHAAGDIRRAGEQGAAWVIAATRMGGMLGCATEPQASFFPGHGGLAGFVKTLALEWPGVHCKLIDVDDAMASRPSALASVLLDEMAQESRREETEVGYCEGRRRVPRPVRAPVSQRSGVRLEIDSDWVLLVTGGARGITAAVACDLAERYRPTVLVVGRSAEPEAEEAPETASLRSPQELKRVLIEQLRRDGKPPAPAEVEAAYHTLCKQREMRENLARMRNAGATVEYHRVDVRDEAAFGGLIESLYESYGRIDGVIHGAGVIEDKLLEQKADDSFDRVLETKTNSAFVLSRKLRGESLKFLVFFTSMAGRFGNRGQADYAAANEVLNKLAVLLDKQWAARVVAMNWGPWLTGMVSPEVKRQFEQRGVQLIPPADGARALNDELRHGSKGEVEVILGGGPWEGYARTTAPSASWESLPLLSECSKVEDRGTIEAVCRLDAREDLFLRDHKLDGKPVFPLAMAMEFAAEVVQHAWPELTFVGIRSMTLLNGIVLDDGPKDIRAVARAQTDPPRGSPDLEVNVEIAESAHHERPSYRCTVLLAERLPRPPSPDSKPFAPLHELPMTVAECYERWLFHGPCFQGIKAVHGIDERGVHAELRPSRPSECLANGPDGRWLIDPIVLDCGFQLGILWERMHYDMTPLPARIEGYRRFGSFSGSPVACYFVARPSARGRILNGDLYFYGPEGDLVSVIENMQTACSKELNRLAEPLSGVSSA